MGEDRHMFDVGPGADMQRKYDWFAKRRPKISLNPANVPAEFHDLIPFAERWGSIAM